MVFWGFQIHGIWIWYFPKGWLIDIAVGSLEAREAFSQFVFELESEGCIIRFFVALVNAMSAPAERAFTQRVARI
jgi:hypothetical protein